MKCLIPTCRLGSPRRRVGAGKSRAPVVSLSPPYNQSRCEAEYQCHQHSNMQQSVLLSLLGLAASATALSVEKAASPYVNLGCQCSSLTFLDSAGVVQGNCLTTDSTGARWCYVDSNRFSSCQDLVPSQRFPHNPWSYEACATPLANPAPAPIVAVHPDPIHHHPVVAAPVHVHPAAPAAIALPGHPVAVPAFPAGHGPIVGGHHQAPGHNIDTQPAAASGVLIPKADKPTK